VKHQNTLLVVHETLQSLQEQMKEAETARELAQRRAEEAEQLVQSIQNPQAEVPQPAASAYVYRYHHRSKIVNPARKTHATPAATPRELIPATTS
jgi:hypothetical protein